MKNFFKFLSRVFRIFCGAAPLEQVRIFKSRNLIPSEMARLGKLFKNERGKLKMSIQQIANRTMLTPTYIYKLEVGAFKTIGIENLLKLARFYKIPIETLLKKVGFLDSSGNELPEFSFCLRSKYRYPQGI